MCYHSRLEKTDHTFILFLLQEGEAKKLQRVSYVVRGKGKAGSFNQPPEMRRQALENEGRVRVMLSSSFLFFFRKNFIGNYRPLTSVSCF
jgi:hypothetical protein